MPLKFSWDYENATLNLSITAHKTVRVQNDGYSHHLPPSLGPLDIYKGHDTQPVISLNDKEATWFDFNTHHAAKTKDGKRYTVEADIALKVFVGNINAVTGKIEEGDQRQLIAETETTKQNYMVIPVQPWLDGFKADHGDVFQFIATQLGEGLSVEEIMDTAKKPEGGIRFVAMPVKPEYVHIEEEQWVARGFFECAFAMPSMEMGLGMGGRIKQDIIKDIEALGTERFDVAQAKTVHLGIIEEIAFKTLLHLEADTRLVKQKNYEGVWFDYQVPHAYKTDGGKTPFVDQSSAIDKETPDKANPSVVLTWQHQTQKKVTPPFVIDNDFQVVDEPLPEATQKMNALLMKND